jgi:hypothetical protein
VVIEDEIELNLLAAGIPRGADQGNDLERRRQTGFCDQRIGVRSGAAEIR